MLILAKGKVVTLNDLEYAGFNEPEVADEEVDALFDSFCDLAADALLPKDGDVSVLNPDGMRKFNTVYNAVKKMLHGQHAKITYGINEPYVGSGFIRIIGKKILLKNTAALMRAARLASNFEVYPRVDETVCMAFSFDGLALK